MKSLSDFKNGQNLLIDKPLNWTSFQVVNKIRWEIKRAYNIKNIKVGHAGTLDPLSTGLLILCTGKFTKQIENYQSLEKEYEGVITVGGTTPSYDLEFEVDNIFPVRHITKELICKTTKKFVGEIYQKPPIFSALKKGGKHLYKLAREGETTNINPRKITISDFEITNIELPNIGFRVVCSKGTYIRSLAYDFGKALQSGAYLSALRRTRIGEFSVENAIEIKTFISNLKK